MSSVPEVSGMYFLAGLGQEGQVIQLQHSVSLRYS